MAACAALSSLHPLVKDGGLTGALVQAGGSYCGKTSESEAGVSCGHSSTIAGSPWRQCDKLIACIKTVQNFEPGE